MNPNNFDSITFSFVEQKEPLGFGHAVLQAKDFIDACYKKGLILVQAAGENTIRIAPSLIISDKEIEEGFKRFEKAVKALK